MFCFPKQDLSSMETIVAPLVYFLLVLSFKMAHTDNQNVTFTTPPNLGLNLTEFTVASTSFNSTVTPTTLLTSTKDTAEYTSTNHGNNTFSTTVAATENTSQHQTSQSATLTSPTGSGSLNTTTPTAQSPPLTITTQTIQTTTHLNTTSDTTLGSTVNSSHSMTTSTVSANATEGKHLLILYHVVNPINFSHHYLIKATVQFSTDGFVLDDDTLVISGGLYDAHPIYDNVPPTPAEPSLFVVNKEHDFVVIYSELPKKTYNLKNYKFQACISEQY
uniref:Uncharacterized protein n=1 Tax=Xiphophorus maculatus TaxID=8083 RepID=A0A3B5QL77_XIPMA